MRTHVLLLLLILQVAIVRSRRLVTLEPDQTVEHQDWNPQERAHADTKIQLVFAIKHDKSKVVQALDELENSVANPDSPGYGAFWDVQKMQRYFSPPIEHTSAVWSWLRGHKADTNCTHVTDDFITCVTTVARAEDMLTGAKFHTYKHGDTGMVVIRSSTPYRVPREIAQSIDFVGGLHRFPAIPKKPALNDAQGRFGITTPSKIRALYNMASSDAGTLADNTQSVPQFLNQYYHPEDLVQFMEMFGAGFPHMDAVAQVVGPNPQEGKAGMEASLDVQYVMSTGANVSTVFWSTDSSHSNMDPFLEWILAVANTSTPPNVISVSYGGLEKDCSHSFLNRMNTEFAKLGLRGVSVLFASGDWGANCLFNKYEPVFPATSPYITSVGATKLGRGNEEAVSFSSGGFSDFFPIPKYQSDVVETFLNSSTDLPNNKYYNTSGRGFPDIAALGVNYVIVTDGLPKPGVEGTSASSPVVAGMFALINDIRLRIGKERLGFLNPLLYSKKSAFTDVTAGCQSGGCSARRGFCAMQGWDPVTGLGTPLFNQWKQQFTG